MSWEVSVRPRLASRKKKKKEKKEKEKKHKKLDFLSYLPDWHWQFEPGGLAAKREAGALRSVLTATPV